MTRKRTLFALFIALFLVGFAARGPIISTFFEWYLKSYCRTCLSSRLTYENLRQEDGGWVLDNPVLATKARLEEGGYRCQADSAALKVSVSWLQRSLTLSVNVENPHLHVGKEADDLSVAFNEPSHSFQMFEIQTELNVPQGTIFLHDFTEEHLVPIPFFFQINLACKNNRQGCAAVWMGDKMDAKAHFSAIFSENASRDPLVTFELINTDCSYLKPVLKGLCPNYKSLEIVKGNVSGKIAVTYPKNSAKFAEGSVILNDLVIHHKGIDGEIEISEFSLNLAPKEVVQENLITVHTIGSLNIQASKITLWKEGKLFWVLDGITGTATLNKEDFTDFNLSGTVGNRGKTRKLFAYGRGHFAQEGHTSFAVDIDLKGDEVDSNTNFHFSAKELNDEWCCGEVGLSGFGGEELNFVQHLIAKNYPEWEHVHIHQGNIDAALLVYLKEFRLSEVKIERIAAHRLAFSFDPWNLDARVENALGSLSFDLSNQDPLNTLNVDLKINQGKLSLEGVNKASWELSGIDTDLTIKEGLFQQSLLKGTVAGLKAEIELNGTSTGPRILFNFHGDVKDFAKALPDPLRKGLDKEFVGDELKIIANAKKTAEGMLFNGKISVETQGVPDEDVLFGFTLGRSSQTLWGRWPPPPVAAKYFPEVGFEVMHAFVPVMAMPLYSAYRHLISQDVAFAGFNLKEGWFRAEKLPLNKYLSPFLFENDQMHLGGIGEFSGHFDGKQLVINYDAQEMVLENSDFAIEIKSLSGNKSAQKRLPAVFLFDFDKGASFNTFLVHNATYFEKNSGLLYTEINAKLSMEDNSAHFEDLTAFCNGLYFAGSADIDWGVPGEGAFEVDLHAHEMHGKISQLQHLLSHLNESLVFLKIPVEGNASLHKEGGHLHFSFYKDGYNLDSIIQGTMTDGKISGQNVDLSLQELNMNFDYRHKQNTLELSDIQGTLLVGKPNHVEEYTVAGDRVRFTDYDKNEAEFDIWVGNKTRDIIRVAGKTRSSINENGDSYINFMFNKSLSHFGDVHPTTFQLGFKDWTQLEVFKLTFDFQLKTLLADLQKFSRTGLFFLSRTILKELNEVEAAKGAFKANLNYDSARSILNYRLDGSEVAIGHREFRNFLLSGTKNGGLWSVDQMQLDNLSLAFDVLKEGPLWKINFLGARIDDYLLIGMEGQFSEENSLLDAKINLLETDLSHLSDLPLLNAAIGVSGFDLPTMAGQLRASGTLSALFDKTLQHGMGINLQMVGSLSHAKIRDVFLDDIKNMSFQYETSRGLSIRHVNAGIKSGDLTLKAGMFLQEASFNTSNRELLIDGLYFDIPAKNLAWTVNALKDNFPGKITQQVADIVRSAKSQGSLQGSLRLSASEFYSSLRLNLNDGIYRFMGNEHDLSDFVIDYDPFSLKVLTEYRYKKQRLRLDAHSATSSFDSGEIVLSDLSTKNISPTPLTIHWKIDPQEGYYIQKMIGDLSGMTFDLVHDSNQQLSPGSMHLVGTLDLNFHKAGKMMDDHIAAGIANLEMGKGYSLKGQWSILKGQSKSLADSLFFHGELKGKDFDFYGYRFYDLSALFSYSPDAAYIRNLTIADACGNLQIAQMDFFPAGTGYWQTTIPQLNCNEFRPSLLHSATVVSARINKSLVIRSLEIKDLSGTLGDKNSFTGNGQLTFANPPKKNLPPSFLAIPAELLTRIGLDLAVLTPVRGTVIFDIKEGKAALNRFKDVYSKGRLSKFYLPNNGYGSYVDFAGNLNLQVRMKQYNIIFKLAELFTVTVQGTLKKPTYTLQKQQKLE